MMISSSSPDSARSNPYYNLRNKIFKLEGPHKAMQLNKWNESLENLLRSSEPSMTPRGLLNFYPHCTKASIKVFYPDTNSPNPPVNVRLVPIPKQIPQVSLDADLNAHKLRDLQNAPYVKYTAAILEVWHEVMASFDDSIYSSIKAMAGAGNIMDIDLSQIY